MNRMGTRSMPRRPDHAGFDSPEHIAYDMLVFVSAFAGGYGQVLSIDRGKRAMLVHGWWTMRTGCEA